MKRPKQRTELGEAGGAGLAHGWYVLRTPGRRAKGAARRLATTLFKRHAVVSGVAAKRAHDLPPRPLRHRPVAAEPGSGGQRALRTTRLAYWLWWLALVGALVTGACVFLATQIELAWSARGVLAPSREEALTSSTAGAPMPRKVIAFVPARTALLVKVGAPARIRFEPPRAGAFIGARVRSVGRAHGDAPWPATQHEPEVRVELELDRGQTSQRALPGLAGTSVTAYIALRKPHPFNLLRENLAVLNARWRSPSSDRPPR
ncbi:MAG TPA: hypothetical protein VI299_14215 [Polyangiales bacterium]